MAGTPRDAVVVISGAAGGSGRAVALATTKGVTHGTDTMREMRNAP